MGDKIEHSIYFSLLWLVRNAAEGKKFADYNEQKHFNYTLSSYVLGTFDLFGFLSIEHADPEAGCGWRYKSILPTPFGIAMAEVLLECVQTLQLDNQESSGLFSQAHGLVPWVVD